MRISPAIVWETSTLVILGERDGLRVDVLGPSAGAVGDEQHVGDAAGLALTRGQVAVALGRLRVGEQVGGLLVGSGRLMAPLKAGYSVGASS
ncbi:hypothetical protein GCM10023336_52350 [Streptomyces similanensis]|uniref:Uncharacterized protein n=1 Tax=Streptomyces similanensis TaxID=1274988 RepID=A0ABP9L2M1_9ACTN